HGAPHTAGEADDLAAAIADGADAVQRAPDARAVVVPKEPDPFYHVRQVITGHSLHAERRLGPQKARLRFPSEVKNNLEQVVAVGPMRQRLLNAWWQHGEQVVEISAFLFWHTVYSHLCSGVMGSSHTHARHTPSVLPRRGPRGRAMRASSGDGRAARRC